MVLFVLLDTLISFVFFHSALCPTPQLSTRTSPIPASPKRRLHAPPWQGRARAAVSFESQYQLQWQ